MESGIYNRNSVFRSIEVVGARFEQIVLAQLVKHLKIYRHAMLLARVVAPDAIGGIGTMLLLVSAKLAFRNFGAALGIVAGAVLVLLLVASAGRSRTTRLVDGYDRMTPRSKMLAHGTEYLTR